MREVEELIYRRMIGDYLSGGLLHLLGEEMPWNPATDTTNRILHSFQVATPPSPGITYGVTSAIKGQIPRQTMEAFITFNIFAHNYEQIAHRLRRLFDNWQHNLSLISGGNSEIGQVSSIFDFEGPDGFDDSLEVQKKDLRFRFFIVPKAQSPI